MPLLLAILQILDGSDAYESKAAASVKYLGSDTTGKSVIIEGVNADGAFDFAVMILLLRAV